ncbi:hypothetical protein B0T16DRAFT_453312 [Cercophora newfieldiana]|uniref:Uncharacterized protein n=1 Tax=Cercophora newfieldiana TaxID=92897 RepID=A0AA39YTW4_9PEZI|nr:hypothetical protein B0T16DRAFT_453312 [Cercophora newfieldiana]
MALRVSSFPRTSSSHCADNFYVRRDVSLDYLPWVHKWHPPWDLVPLLIWTEVEVNIAVIFSCAAAYKALVQSLFPSFMSGLGTGSTSGKLRTDEARSHTPMLKLHDKADGNSWF